MPKSTGPQPKNEEETRRPQRDAWTPARGLAKGSSACLLAALVLGAAWCAVARRVPEATVAYLHEDAKVTLFLVFIGALVGFVASWILFAVMHRTSHMVGGLCPLIVAAFVVLIVLAKQLVLVRQGVKLPSGLVIGWAWLEPVNVLKSNLGTWLGIVVAVHLFREGDSIVDLF